MLSKLFPVPTFLFWCLIFRLFESLRVVFTTGSIMNIYVHCVYNISLFFSLRTLIFSMCINISHMKARVLNPLATQYNEYIFINRLPICDLCEINNEETFLKLMKLTQYFLVICFIKIRVKKYVFKFFL